MLGTETVDRTAQLAAPAPAKKRRKCLQGYPRASILKQAGEGPSLGSECLRYLGQPEEAGIWHVLQMLTKSDNVQS